MNEFEFSDSHQRITSLQQLDRWLSINNRHHKDNVFFRQTKLSLMIIAELNDEKQLKYNGRRHALGCRLLVLTNLLQHLSIIALQHWKQKVEIRNCHTDSHKLLCGELSDDSHNAHKGFSTKRLFVLPLLFVKLDILNALNHFKFECIVKLSYADKYNLTSK